MNNMTATAAWRRALDAVIRHGAQVAPRGQKTLELPQQTTVVDLNWPIVASPLRRLSYVYLAAEALWVLSGDDRVETIAPYNERLREFSDDGLRFFGAYGPRIMGQLPYVVRKLAADPDTRQAVLTTWRSSPPTTRDVPCLAGDTLINSPEGNITIAELARKFSSGELVRFPVFAWDKDTREVKLTWMTSAWRTGRKKLLKLTFDDSSVLKCTSDHVLWKKIRRKDATCEPHGSVTFVDEVSASALTIGDRVWATHFITNSRKHRPSFIKNLSMNWHFNNQGSVHIEYARLLFGDIPDGYDVHHKNEDVEDNRATNLEVILHADHSALKMNGDLNPMRHETSKANTQRRLRLRKTFKRMGYKVKPLSKYPTNHIIISIEELPTETVYDFIVPDGHSCSTGTGVMVHNCTVALAFQLRGGRLNAHAFMRSSDLWLGWPYDVFTFAMVTATVCQRLNTTAFERGGPLAAPGTLWLTAASSHLYEKNAEEARACVAEITSITPTEPLPLALFDGDPRRIEELQASLVACRDRHDSQWAQPWIIRPGIERLS